MIDAQISTVRAFNRFWTKKIGALGSGHLGTKWSLTESRVLFEVAQREATAVAELKAALALDAGQLSRVVAGLRDQGLAVEVDVDGDRRKRALRLSAAGKRAFKELDARACVDVGELFGPLDGDRRAGVVTAMATIRAAFEEGEPRPTPITLGPPEPGDLGWVVMRHGALYAEEYRWDSTFEALVAGIVAELGAAADPRQTAFIARAGSEKLGSIFCTRKSETVAQLRLLLVEPSARERGVGQALIDACLAFAKGAGYRRMMLWTNHPLTSARRLYERAGFELRSEEPGHRFGKQLVAQVFEKTLR